mmetsp:Transcript_14982/g.25590  ORF Transcript_14982/g.25590 Transcript_14982/m.25590 type:complete len:328 (-) Transcript_14982:117-1100(-)
MPSPSAASSVSSLESRPYPKPNVFTDPLRHPCWSLYLRSAGMCPRGGSTFGWPSVSRSTAPRRPLTSAFLRRISRPVWRPSQRLVWPSGCSVLSAASAFFRPAAFMGSRSNTVRAVVLYATSANRSDSPRALITVRTACFTTSSTDSPCASLAPCSFCTDASTPIEPDTSTTHTMSVALLRLPSGGTAVTITTASFSCPSPPFTAVIAIVTSSSPTSSSSNKQSCSISFAATATRAVPPLRLCSIASRRARFGTRSVTESGERVTGDVLFRESHSSIARRSYVFPSGSTTGSSITSPVRGHMKLGTGSSLGPAGVGPARVEEAGWVV